MQMKQRTLGWGYVTGPGARLSLRSRKRSVELCGCCTIRFVRSLRAAVSVSATVRTPLLMRDSQQNAETKPAPFAVVVEHDAGPE